jgi:hypothetical protein
LKVDEETSLLLSSSFTALGDKMIGSTVAVGKKD